MRPAITFLNIQLSNSRVTASIMLKAMAIPFLIVFTLPILLHPLFFIVKCFIPLFIHYFDQGVKGRLTT